MAVLYLTVCHRYLNCATCHFLDSLRSITALLMWCKDSEPQTACYFIRYPVPVISDVAVARQVCCQTYLTCIFKDKDKHLRYGNYLDNPRIVSLSIYRNALNLQNIPPSLKTLMQALFFLAVNACEHLVYAVINQLRQWGIQLEQTAIWPLFTWCLQLQSCV